jgi:hypothetical protein
VRCSRLEGLHPDLVRVVERAIQITIQDFRGQEGLLTRERQAELVARAASRTMNSRISPATPSIWSRWVAADQLVVGGLLSGRHHHRARRGA